MTNFVCGSLLLIGTLFMVVAGVGLLRMPDLMLRMSATTKAATLGAGCILLGTAIYFQDAATITRSSAAILFIFLTAPVAAHVIGRAAYFDKIPLWEGTVVDELRDKYNKDASEGSQPEPPSEETRVPTEY